MNGQIALLLAQDGIATGAIYAMIALGVDAVITDRLGEALAAVHAHMAD